MQAGKAETLTAAPDRAESEGRGAARGSTGAVFLMTGVLSLALHGAVFAAASRIEIRVEKPPQTVKMRVYEPPPPPPPPPEAPKPPEPPPPEPEAPKPAPKPKPKAERAPVRKDPTQKVEAPKPSAEPPPPRPAPPPMGFSVDMSSTVVGGGVAVTAVEGGGNMFADPNDKTLKPGQKTGERPPPPDGDGTGTGRGDVVETMPKFLTSGDDRVPPYPDEAREAGIEGRVLLRVYVGASGTVEQVKVLKGLGYGCDEAAVGFARKKWRFEPATRGGRPIAKWITVPVIFELER